MQIPAEGGEAQQHAGAQLRAAQDAGGNPNPERHAREDGSMAALDGPDPAQKLVGGKGRIGSPQAVALSNRLRALTILDFPGHAVSGEAAFPYAQHDLAGKNILQALALYSEGVAGPEAGQHAGAVYGEAGLSEKMQDLDEEVLLQITTGIG
ncbi:MAG: hypothetical protein ABSG23_09985 [Terriglobales bacterium]|jgi:hypothetical protein